MPLPPLPSTLFPYTTLFRSHLLRGRTLHGAGQVPHRRADRYPCVVLFSVSDDEGTDEGAAACDPGHEHHRSEEHTSELQSPCNLVCRLLLEKKKKNE